MSLSRAFIGLVVCLFWCIIKRFEGAINKAFCTFAVYLVKDSFYLLKLQFF